MKDEYAMRSTIVFYDLMANSVELLNKATKKGGGVSKMVVKCSYFLMITKKLLMKEGRLMKQNYIFKSNLNTIYKELKNKVALSAFLDRRYFIQGDLQTFA